MGITLNCTIFGGDSKTLAGEIPKRSGRIVQFNRAINHFHRFGSGAQPALDRDKAYQC